MYIPSVNSFFVHIPKTGGVSIETAFFHRDGIAIKHHNVVGQLSDDQKKYYRYGNYDSSIKVNGPLQHFTALQAKEYVSEFEECYTFAIVRNPWDRLISEMFWRNQRLNTNITIDRLITQCENETKRGRNGNCHYIPQWLYTHDDNGNQLVDDIFKLEDMDNNVKTINNRLNVDLTVGKANSTDREDYRSYYTPELVKQVGKLYERDIEYFGYDF